MKKIIASAAIWLTLWSHPLLAQVTPVDPPPVDNPPSPVATGKIPVTLNRLTQSPWQLVELNGRRITASGKLPYVRFAQPGKVLGFGGCNIFSGRYTQDGSTLLVTKLNATRKACGDAGSLEQPFMSTLVMSNSYQLEDGQLILSLMGRPLMRLRPAPSLSMSEFDGVNEAQIGKYARGKPRTEPKSTLADARDRSKAGKGDKTDKTDKASKLSAGKGEKCTPVASHKDKPPRDKARKTERAKVVCQAAPLRDSQRQVRGDGKAHAPERPAGRDGRASVRSTTDRKTTGKVTANRPASKAPVTTERKGKGKGAEGTKKPAAPAKAATTAGKSSKAVQPSESRRH